MPSVLCHIFLDHCLLFICIYFNINFSLPLFECTYTLVYLESTTSTISSTNYVRTSQFLSFSIFPILAVSFSSSLHQSLSKFNLLSLQSFGFLISSSYCIFCSYIFMTFLSILLFLIHFTYFFLITLSNVVSRSMKHINVGFLFLSNTFFCNLQTSVLHHILKSYCMSSKENCFFLGTIIFPRMYTDVVPPYSLLSPESSFLHICNIL